MPDLDPVLSLIDRERDDAVTRLCAWLEIPSVSTDPAFVEPTRAAGQWVADRLEAMGFDVEMLPTAGHPVVVGHTRDERVANPAAPRVLFYGHYDVQPPDPVEKWTTPPFEPTVRDGQIYARGALDDKGQVATMLEAIHAWTTQGDGKLPGPMTVMIEGEEEMGSIHLPPFIEANRDKLAADIVLVSDTSMWDAATPAITYGLRGLVYFDLQLHGPSRDLHSGVYGGTLANPATVLARVLGRLFDDDHRIAIPGFYDDVDPITDDERQRWAALNFDETAFLDEVGSTPQGEAGMDTLARRWARPSCDVNGLYGGYMGEGAKTVIPTFAGAKVSFRIPTSMDPHKVARQFREWIAAQDVGGLEWKITNHGEAWPVSAPLDSPFMAAAAEAVERVFDKPPAFMREGASIPVVADFKRLLGLDTILLGFGLDSDAIHSPDEHFAIDRLIAGAKCHAALLARVGEMSGV